MGSVEIAVVQHVTKKSSDELLSKFADDQPEEVKLDLQVVVKRRKRSRGGGEDSETRLGERNSLLPPVKRRSALLRQMGIKNKSLLATIEKTWRRSIEGASKVFVEKHYNRHKRLISDIQL